MNKSPAKENVSEAYRMRQLHNYISEASLGIKKGQRLGECLLLYCIFKPLRLLNPVGSEDYRYDTAPTWHQIQGHSATYQIKGQS